MGAKPCKSSKRLDQIFIKKVEQKRREGEVSQEQCLNVDPSKFDEVMLLF